MNSKLKEDVKAGWKECSDFEQKVMEMVVHGHSSPEIAKKISTKKEPRSYRSVENTILLCSRFFKAKNKTHLTAKLVAAGVVEVKH